MARYLAAESAGPLHGGALTSASFGPGATAAIITTANRGQITTGAGSAWLSLPPLPAGHGHPGPRPGGAADALAFRGGTLTVWQHAPGGTAWAKIQVINVPRAQAEGDPDTSGRVPSTRSHSANVASTVSRRAAGLTGRREDFGQTRYSRADGFCLR